MVKFLDINGMVQLVQAIGPGPLISAIAEAIESDFRRWDAFEHCPRLAAHSPDGVIELMPATDGDLFGFKYVNGHPKNYLKGLQTVSAFGVLCEVATGYPIFLSEMTVATALRTAATSALAARYLARPNAASMAIIGLGAQSEFQAIGFQTLLGVQRLQVYDIDPAATEKFLRNMQGSGIDILVARSAAEAVLGVDIITTVTADKQNAMVLSDNMVSSGVHINAVGGDCPGKTEVQAKVLNRAAIFVEYEPQTRVEGEIQQLSADFPVTELWRVILDQTQGRRSPHDITLFDSVGFALEDFSTLRVLRELSERHALSRRIDLLASPNDPRDLLGLLMPEATPECLHAFA